MANKSRDVVYSVVIPVYNEEKAIFRVLDEVKNAVERLNQPYEIITVDDGSKDKSIQEINRFISEKKHQVRIVKHQFNRGYGASIKDGVIASKSANIITIDADLTYPAYEIPRLVKYLDRYVLVNGSRTGKKVHIPLIRKPGKLIHTLFISMLAGRYIPDMNSGLRVFKKGVFLKFLPLYPEGFSISTTFLLACVTNKYPVKFLPIDYFQRKGKSKIRIFYDGFNFLLLILRSLMYFNPLRIFIPLSLMFLLIGGSFLLYRLYVALDVPEVSVMLIITSFLVAFFGLIADTFSKILLSLNKKE